MNSNDFLLIAKRFKEALILLQDDGRILECNAAALQLFEQERSSFLQKNLSNFLSLDPQKLQKHINLWKSSGDFLPAKCSLRKPDGSMLECKVEGCRLKVAKDGEPGLLLLRCISKVQSTKSFVVLNDKIQQLSKEIHERIKVENGLRESEEKVRLLLHSTAEAIYGVNSQGLCTFANKTLVDMLGYQSESELIGKNMHKLIHLSDNRGESTLTEGSPITRAYKDSEEVYCDDALIWKLNGATIPVEYWAYPIQNSNETIGAVVTLLDITEKKQINNALRTLAQSTSSIIGNQFFENCVRSLSQITKADMAFVGAIDKFDPLQMNSLAMWFDDNLQENISYSLMNTPCMGVLKGSPNYIKTGLGGKFPTDDMINEMRMDSYYGVPLISSENRVIGIASIMGKKPMHIDEHIESSVHVFAKRISMELEQQETTSALQEYRDHLESLVSQRTKELEQACNELESYSYSIAHDLRSPLRSIMSFSQILKSELGEKLNEIELDYFNRVINSSQFMSELINDILELSSISRKDIVQSRVNISQIVKLIATDKTQHANNRKFNIQVTDNVYARGDKKLIYVLLDNLIENAVKFSEKKPETSISFSCYQDVDRQTVCVLQDNGAGFNMEYGNKLFKPFQRLHSRDEFYGTGIGLATVKRIVERHNGKIWIESQVNQGTRVYFTLPSLEIRKPAVLEVN